MTNVFSLPKSHPLFRQVPDGNGGMHACLCFDRTEARITPPPKRVQATRKSLASDGAKTQSRKEKPMQIVFDKLQPETLRVLVDDPGLPRGDLKANIEALLEQMESDDDTGVEMSHSHGGAASSFVRSCERRATAERS